MSRGKHARSQSVRSGAVRKAAAIIAVTALAGAGYGLQVTSAHAASRIPSCGRELAAYRLVSRQAGLRIGSVYTGRISGGSNNVWAGELAAAGDLPLAHAAAGIVDDWSDAQFVMALTSAADAAVMVVTGHASHAGVCRR